MDRIQNSRIGELVNQRPTTVTQPKTGGVGNEFADILANRLKLSGHAETRLQSRGINLDAQAWDRVMQGVEKAAAKGVKESLVLVDDVALVVSVKNRTVITAVEKAALKENVFTNIDGAIVV